MIVAILDMINANVVSTILTGYSFRIDAKSFSSADIEHANIFIMDLRTILTISSISVIFSIQHPPFRLCFLFDKVYECDFFWCKP